MSAPGGHLVSRLADVMPADADDCWSQWEGCLCDLMKDHKGLHLCGSQECGRTWTTEQGEAWIVAIRPQKVYVSETEYSTINLLTGEGIYEQVIHDPPIVGECR